MTSLELSRDEAGCLRRILLGEPEREPQLLVLVRDGRAVRAVRSDRGALTRIPPDLHVGGIAHAHSHTEGEGIEQLVAVRIDEPAAPSLLEGLLQGSVTTDPPLLPALDRFRGLRPAVRGLFSWLLPDGIYGLGLQDASPSFYVRLRRGRVERLGATGPSTDAEISAEECLLRDLRRLGPVRLLIVGSQEAVSRIARSRRPITELDRSFVRGELRLMHATARVRLTLLVLRVLGG